MLALVFSLLALTAPSPKAPVIAPEEAAQHLEQHVIVRGTVTQVVVTKNLTTHVHFGGIYPNQVFTATFFKASRSEFPGVQDYEGKVVEVEGVLHMARNKPEILIIRRTQLRLADQTPAAK
jgi:DNA/RNA endonuclease YhcR with UshA esterase domain